MAEAGMTLGHGQPPESGGLTAQRPLTLAEEHVLLLWQVTARAEEMLTAAAHGRWPGAELAALAGYAQSEVLAQTSDEEALLFPAAPVREVAGLARDHARLRSAVEVLARTAAGEQPMSPAQAASAVRDFVTQLERHLRAEDNLLASQRAPQGVEDNLLAWQGAPQGVPGTAALGGHPHEWYPLTEGPVVDLDALPDGQALAAAVDRLLRMRRSEQVELRSSTDLDPVWREISELSPGSYRFTVLQDGPARWRMQVTREGLASAGLASPGPRGWALGHRLVGQAMIATMRQAETARCHALLARALKRCGADPAETARHLAASGDADGAARAYSAAARRRLDRICDREAMRLAETGLSLDPGGRIRAALLEARGEACRRAGQLAAARADFTAALDSLDDPAYRSRVLAQLAILDARTADAARGSELAALAIAEAGNQPAALGQALAAGAIIDLTEGNLARARHRVRRAAGLLEQAGDSRGSARLLYWRAMVCFIGGSLREAVSKLDHLAHLPATPGEVLRLWSPRATRGHALAFLGQAADGLEEIEDTLAWARAARHPAVEAECLWRRAEALAILGRPGQAIESAGESAGIASRIGHAEWTAAAHRGLGIALEAAGLPGSAESAYRRSLRAAEGLPLFRAWAAVRLGAFLARQGRPAEAEPHVRAALAGGTPLTRHEARWAQAELLASRGDDEACRATATAALERAKEGGYLILVPRLGELAGR
jgi:tetratricopeptide (TPR) repeat protein